MKCWIGFFNVLLLTPLLTLHADTPSSPIPPEKFTQIRSLSTAPPIRTAAEVYEWDRFHNRLYDWPNWFAAARSGNPDAIVAFNDGAFCMNKIKPKPVTPLEDYHAGEVHCLVNGKIKLGHDQNSPLYLPDSQFIEGVQWHALVPVDSTFEGGKPYHYGDEELFGFVKRCKSVSGAVTLNLPVGQDGVIPGRSFEQMARLGQALGGAKR